MVLPLVLVLSVVLSLVIVGIATYAAGTLRLGQAVEESADRIAAAEGGLDWALDRYSRGLTTCGSAVGSESVTFQGEVNGLKAEVSCTLVGASIPAASGYALVMTGEELPDSNPKALLTRTGANSESKELRGPIYMENPTFSIGAPLDLLNGWLLHNGSCDGSFVESNPSLPVDFTIVSPGRAYCTDQTWKGLFKPNGPIPNIDPLTITAAPDPESDPNGCVIWSPGKYSAANKPDFASADGGGPTYNYFISGDYYFDDLGELDLKGSYVLAGYPGVSGPNLVKIKPQDTFDNHPCREAWWYDGFKDPSKLQGDRQGATWYLGGSSSVYVNASAAIEISGRAQSFMNSLKTARVSLQTIDPGEDGGTTVLGVQEVMTTKGGSGSQMAMRGMVWTPYSSFNFDNIANDVVAALQGGAVVSTLGVGAAAQTDGFLIEVSLQPLETQLQIESTATNTGTATVRAIVDYQPSPPEVSLISRRVLDITPE